MRVPLEYGDNFPILSDSWNPAIPWRFPKVGGKGKGRSLLGRIFPWVMLGVGVAVGILWMSWRQGMLGIERGTVRPAGYPATEQAGEAFSPTLQVPPADPPQGIAPRSQPAPRMKSRLA
ncbi:MAG: hypothetical protein HYZ93_01420 [Candidatus Omnitrophica bacterium]|nr:hypothetical protein [Candidatus Omnitrophota bacterium]